MQLNIAAARLAMGKLTSEEALVAASAALNSGLYSDSLGLLIFEEPVWSQVGPLFERALSELRVPIPSSREASLVLAREQACRILTGELSPYEGAHRIWRLVANEPGADPSLGAFIGLASEWEDAPDYRPHYERQIMDAARLLVVGGGYAAPDTAAESGSR